MWEAGRGELPERAGEERQSALPLPLPVTHTHSPPERQSGAEWVVLCHRENDKQRKGPRTRVRLLHTDTHARARTHTLLSPYTHTHARASSREPLAARLEGTARTPSSHTRTHVRTPTDTHTPEHAMVVQGAVTPGRTRRLMLKLPVGTLRRNSGERVRHKLHFLPTSLSLS